MAVMCLTTLPTCMIAWQWIIGQAHGTLACIQYMDSSVELLYLYYSPSFGGNSASRDTCSLQHP